MTKRRIAIAVAAVVLVAGVVAGRERPALEIIESRAAVAAADDGIDLGKLRRGEASLPQNDVFALRNFDANPAPAAAGPAAPAKPAAPPLPFQYIGKWTQAGKTDVLVMRGDELVAIEAGQTLGEYRVDKIGDTSIAFTYLPLKTKQTLDFQ
jgi:hypothetical protein